MKDYIVNRALEEACYILKTKSTVRKAGKAFGVSKSTVCKDMIERLPKINPQIAEEVKEVLEYNKSVRHIRGGLQTRERWKNR